MLRLLAPAKINLYLRVLGKRPDGYHEIETLFERIDLADELTFEPGEGLTLTCDDPALSCGEENLILRAARRLQQHAGASPGARVHLTKRIPVAAGLGGGSSDAAAALQGLNALWQLGLSDELLARLGAELGSDVPFFLQPAPFAIGRGRGELCEPVPVRTALCHVLVCPPEQLSTQEVYQGAQFSLTASKPSITMLLHALSNGSLGELAAGLWNDLEPEAIRRCPRIALIQNRLRSFDCLGVRVSGSGPSLHVLCRDLAHAQSLAGQVRTALSPLNGTRVEVVRTAS